MAWSSSSCCAKDVPWHNELPLTAADAAFTFAVYRSDTESAVNGLFALVESLDAVSERELRVRFTARDANWLFNVASLPIISQRPVRRVLAGNAGVRPNTFGLRLVPHAAGRHRPVGESPNGTPTRSGSPG